MKKRAKKKKIEVIPGIYPGKQMMHADRRCIVGYVQDNHALISYPGEPVERKSRTVAINDLRDIPVDSE